jgi:uncharacterized membrane protein YbhN (UPF0104 family)
MKRLLHWFGHLLILAVFLGAAWLLYDRLRDITLAEVWQALCDTPLTGIAAAVVLTVLNYVILIGYDLLAIRWVGEPIPLRRIALASFTGYAFSYNFGATLFGTTIRYRFYSVWGVSLLKILELLVILGLTFWFGLFALAGVVFVAEPLKVPQQFLDEYPDFPIQDTYWFGWALLATALAYVGLSAFYRGSLKLWRWTIPVPPLRLTLYQIGIASADLIVAAGVLYALLPHAEGMDYLRVLGVFMLAFTASVLTHVPGGYGVFELIIVALLPLKEEPTVAAILLFRLIYYWLPLAVAAVMLAAHEIGLRKQADASPPAK